MQLRSGLNRLLSALRWRLQGRAVFDPVPGAGPWWRLRARVMTASGTRAAWGAKRAMARLAVREQALVYCDQAVIGQAQALHKPAWSPQLLGSAPYLGPLVAFPRRLRVSEGEAHERLLAVGEQVERVVRVPSVWAAHRAPFGWLASARAAQGFLARRGVRSAARARVESPFLRLELSPSASRAVTAVIPTKDNPELLSGLLDALHEGTDHRPLEVVVVDNGSTDPQATELLDGLGGEETTVVRAPGPFNFSRLCNLGLDRAETELVLFLNDDVTPRHPGWLAQLVADLDDPTVGAVGPLLLFPDGTIQHAGITLGLGGAAGHPFRGRRPEEDGYFGWSTARREVSAVTAACLLARTDQIREVGGFDEEFPIDFGDVDLCLRLRRDLGLVSLVDPAYPLTHLESATRVARPADPAHVEALLDRWGSQLLDDPYYSPRLPRTNPGYGGIS